nr:MAG TPA: hypothetical protein [Microviridae sp.]
MQTGDHPELAVIILRCAEQDAHKLLLSIEALNPE